MVLEDMLFIIDYKDCCDLRSYFIASRPAIDTSPLDGISGTEGFV
jgi:hypothetical protein